MISIPVKFCPDPGFVLCGPLCPPLAKDGAGSTSPKRVWSMIANTSSRDGGPEAESVNSEAPLLQPGPKRSSWLPRFSRSSAAKP